MADVLHRFAELVNSEIDSEAAQLSESVAEGAASDYADYKKRTGKIAGLRRAQQILQETKRRLYEDGDDKDD